MTLATTGFRHVEQVMGTAVSFDVRVPAKTVYVGGAIDLLHWVDETFSMYRADSQISRIGRGDRYCHAGSFVDWTVIRYRINRRRDVGDGDELRRSVG